MHALVHTVMLFELLHVPIFKSFRKETKILGITLLHVAMAIIQMSTMLWSSLSCDFSKQTLNKSFWKTRLLISIQKEFSPTPLLQEDICWIKGHYQCPTDHVSTDHDCRNSQSVCLSFPHSQTSLPLAVSSMDVCILFSFFSCLFTLPVHHTVDSFVFLPTVTQVPIHCLLLFKHPKRATVFINSVNTMLQNYWNCFALCRLLSKLRHDGVTFITHVILRMQLITATFLIQRKMGKHLTPFCVLIGDWDFRGFQSFF